MPPVHFRSRVNPWIAIILLGSLLICVISLMVLISKMNMLPIGGLIVSIFITALSGGLIAWIFFDTGYHLESDAFRYHSGPVRGKIPYNKIRSLEVGKTEWFGTRPALATRGIILHYNTYDQVYISPDSNKRFVNELRRRIKNIEIKNIL